MSPLSPPEDGHFFFPLDWASPGLSSRASLHRWTTKPFFVSIVHTHISVLHQNISQARSALSLYASFASFSHPQRKPRHYTWGRLWATVTDDHFPLQDEPFTKCWSLFLHTQLQRVHSVNRMVLSVNDLWFWVMSKSLGFYFFLSWNSLVGLLWIYKLFEWQDASISSLCQEMVSQANF